MSKESFIKNLWQQSIPFYIEKESKKEGLESSFYYNKLDHIPRSVVSSRPFVIQGGQNGEVTLTFTWNDPKLNIRFNGENQEVVISYDEDRAKSDDSYDMFLVDYYTDKITPILDEFITRCIESEKTKSLFKLNKPISTRFSRKESAMRTLKRNIMVRESEFDEGDHYDDYSAYEKNPSRKAKSKKLYDELVSKVGKDLVYRAVRKYCDETDVTDIADNIGYGEDDSRYDVGENFCTSGDIEYQVGVIGRDHMYELISEYCEDDNTSYLEDKVEEEADKILRSIKGYSYVEIGDEISNDPFDMSGSFYMVDLKEEVWDSLGLESLNSSWFELYVEDDEAYFRLSDNLGENGRAGIAILEEEVITIPDTSLMSFIKVSNSFKKFIEKIINSNKNYNRKLRRERFLRRKARASRR